MEARVGMADIKGRLQTFPNIKREALGKRRSFGSFIGTKWSVSLLLFFGPFLASPLLPEAAAFMASS